MGDQRKRNTRLSLSVPVMTHHIAVNESASNIEYHGCDMQLSDGIILPSIFESIADSTKAENGFRRRNRRWLKTAWVGLVGKVGCTTLQV